MIGAIAIAAALAAAQGGVSQAAQPAMPPDAASPRQDGRGPEAAERTRANANGQARRRHKTDAPPQMNRDPKAMGSGAPQLPVDQEPPVHGRNYGRAHSHGRAGGIATGKDNPGGASTHGSAGKSRPADPSRH